MKDVVQALGYQIPKLLYPRVPKIRRRWRKALDLKQMHYWHREKMDKYVEEKRKGILRYAATKCLYYAKMFRQKGWDPDRAESYWADWPILTQELLQAHRDDILSTDTNADDMVLDASGGSTGIVKTFYHAPDYSFYTLSTAGHTDGIAGWTPGCRTAYLWAAPTDIDKDPSLATKMKSYLQNIRTYDSFDMGEKQMEEFHRDLSRFRPEIIIAIAGSAFQMARFLKQRGLTPNYPTKGIVTSSETLTEEMRTMIVSVFGPNVFDRYGCREVGLIAFEDEAHSGLHIDFAGNFVEVVNPDTFEPVWEEEGDILVTTLTQPLFPLIRYQVGDAAIATRETCTCGRNSPLLAKVLGRNSDFVTAINGSKIHGEYFSHVLREVEKIQQYVAIQEDMDRITIRIVLSEPLIEQERGEILDEFQRKLGKEMKITFEIVDHIPPLPSGKRRFVISRLEE